MEMCDDFIAKKIAAKVGIFSKKISFSIKI